MTEDDILRLMRHMVVQWSHPPAPPTEYGVFIWDGSKNVIIQRGFKTKDEAAMLRDRLNARAIAAALSAPPVGIQRATDAQIKHMVSRFLNWKLPENFNPDGGITFKREFNENTPWPMKHEPVGTNLLDGVQATAMVRHMLEGLPVEMLPGLIQLNEDEPK